MIIIDTDKAYLLGLLVGGGRFDGNRMQILLPYKNWGSCKQHPERAGIIAEDIIKRLQPLLAASYKMNISYKLEPDWKVICDHVSDDLKNELLQLHLPVQGELRQCANLGGVIPFLSTVFHKKQFISGLADAIGSLAPSHRRFSSDFQIVSFEFKGNNFDLVADVTKILQEIGCEPDQILWNHPNNHSSRCRYYRSWKKGFKIRVALDDYILNASFVFRSKHQSALHNRAEQTRGQKTTAGKRIKLGGRVTLHAEQSSKWLPEKIRGAVFIHYMHFYQALGIKVNIPGNLAAAIKNIEEHICPFTCLTKGTAAEIDKIIAAEEYLRKCHFRFISPDWDFLLRLNDKPALLFGTTEKDGFPINHILHALAYVLEASAGENIKGKRLLRSYTDIIADRISERRTTEIGIPDKGTCLLVRNREYAALVGYVNDSFNRRLLERDKHGIVYMRPPSYEECVVL